MPTHTQYPAIDTNGKITLASRLSALIFVIILPALATIAAIVLAFKGMVTWVDLSLFVVMYCVTGVGLTVGYHRLFTHRSFETYAPIRYTLALLGCMNAEGAPIVWASQHRRHHAFTDERGDPHSPYVGRQPGFLGALRALWHSHYGHIFNQIEAIDPERYAPDLERELLLRVLEKQSVWVVVAGFLIPFAAGWLITRSWMGGLTGLLWGGFVRLFVMTHATGAVNSICHYFGSRRFDTGDESGNVWWLLLPTLGESWHQNHHAFPTSSRHGLKWWELDPSWFLIFGMEKVGLVSNIVTIDPHRQRLKEVKESVRPLTAR
jgi:stearoyl-CoA desaturase (delta-9 desaturase)